MLFNSGNYFSGIKSTIKKGFTIAGIDLTRNMAYDRQTRQIMEKVLRTDSNCIDVGSHSGEVLERMLQLSPKGLHFAFEPVPCLYEKLKKRFSSRASILPYALSDSEGKTGFNYVRNAPAYSGLRKRKYDLQKPDIENIEVVTKTLDSVINKDICIHFIKIDVEGAEYFVIKGGIELIKRCRPFIIFEFGIGASDYYKTGPDDIYDLLVNKCGLGISLLKEFLASGSTLDREHFRKVYESSREYYFIAHPQL